MQQRGVRGARRRQAGADQREREQHSALRGRRQRAQREPGRRDQQRARERELAAFKVYGDVFAEERTHSYTFKDGRVTYSLSPEFGPKDDRCPCEATYEIDGDRVSMDWERSDFFDETVRWSFFRGRLTFGKPNSGDAGDEALYTAHPWKKVR